jgi:phage shock protein A
VLQGKEYIKLLHNALNNLITEASKLKIDHELLKTKIKVLEDKMEFLENRERAIEKKIFPLSDSSPKTKKPKK